MPLNPINWRGRVPQVKNVISPRMVWAAGGLAVLVLVAVYFGFKMRIDKKQALKDSQQAAMVGSDSAPSTRHSVEPGLDTAGEVSTSSLGTPATSGTAGTGKGLIPNPFAVGSGIPTAWQKAQVPGQPATVPPLTAPVTVPVPQPQYAPPIPSPSEQSGSVADLQRAERKRLLQEEIDAREAPTGVQQQAKANTPKAADAVPNPMQQAQDAVNQAQAELSRLGTASRQPVLYGGTPNGNAGAPGETGYQLQNGQADKRKFNDATEDGGDYLKAARVPAISPWVLQRGTEIPMALPAKLLSDLPGDLQATVINDVLDSVDHKYVEIPAGSRAIFEYNSSVSYGQNRVQAVCTAIYFPDGSHIDLDRMPAHSGDGTTGLHDKVDNHYKRLFASVALTSILAAGVQISQNRSGANSLLQYPSTGQEIGSAIGEAASQAGSQLMSRNLDIQPTVWIRPGAMFSLWVKKDIVFPGPYERMEPLSR